MNRTESKEFCLQKEPSFLPCDRSGKGYICPKCGNGSGKDGDGLRRIPKTAKWKCFKCAFAGDIFDLYRAQLEQRGGGVTDKDVFDGVYRYFALDVVSDSHSAGEPPADPEEAPVINWDNVPDTPPEEEPPTDYSAFLLRASQNIERTTYRRGIRLETLKAYHVGYVHEWKHPKSPNAPAKPKLIIPYDKYHYTARTALETLDEREKPYKVQKVGQNAPIYNQRALSEADQPIFVVEGELDALSIIDAGGIAVATGSASNIRKLVSAMDDNPPKHTLMLALDNDKPGREAQLELLTMLTGRGMHCYSIDTSVLFGGCKDANELLMRDRGALTANIEQAKAGNIPEYPRSEHRPKETSPLKEPSAPSLDAKAEQEIQENRERERTAYYANYSASEFIEAFTATIAERASTPCISTGFPKLDAILDGGIYEGLYVLGAISSAGKTTLVMQIADQIAMQGQDVLIFSLEMSRFELVAKSLSRLTFTEVRAHGKSIDLAKDVHGITNAARLKNYTDEEKDVLYRVENRYKEYADHIFIREGLGDISVENVRDQIREHCEKTGHRPVVLIDYLQILTPLNERLTDKQNMDRTVLELKRISRDEKIPILAVSSFNRESYNNPVTMTAFKESGAIEYSSDVLIALQFEGVGRNGFDVNAAKRQSPRRVEAVVLKNRNYQTGIAVTFSYYAKYNCFEERGWKEA